MSRHSTTMTFQINVKENKNKNTPKKEFGRKAEKRHEEENIMGEKIHSQ